MAKKIYNISSTNEYSSFITSANITKHFCIYACIKNLKILRMKKREKDKEYTNVTGTGVKLCTYEFNIHFKHEHLKLKQDVTFLHTI